jgi:predicted 3-demethylubiquinone-9 3-methyltransferase (glyoxalase superfamily)
MSKIAPCLWFDGEAEEAARFYVSLFPESEIRTISRYGESTNLPVHFPPGTALMVEFTLAGERFQALNGGPHFHHSEAISFSIRAKDAAEVDHYWNALTADGGTEGQCGWLKDRFGVSWQVVPEGLEELMCDPDPARRKSAVEAMMEMKKLDLASMRAAADGEGR